jgi:HEAT repeat protein
MTFESAIAELADPNKKLSATQLAGLSHLDGEQLATFRELWDDSTPDRRLALVSDLADLVEDNIELNFDSVFRLALDDSEPPVRAAAITGLYEYDGRDLIPVLSALLIGDPESEVRAEAAVGLGRFALAAEFDHLGDDDAETVRKALTESAEDEDEQDIVRAKAIEALGVLSDEKSQGLIESLYNEDRLWLRVGAVDAMGRSANPGWLPHVITEMTNRAPEMRQAAAFAAGEIASEDAVQGLAEVAAHDPDRQVQLAAIHALGEIGGRVAKVALQAVLFHGDDELQDAVEEAMAEVAFKEDPLNPLGH